MADSRPNRLRRTWARLPRPAARPEPWLTLSLLVGFVLTAAAGSPPPAVPLQLIVLGALLFISFRWPVGRLAVLALVVAGIQLRLGYAHAGSDVLVVTGAAIDTVLAGGNPYGIGYEVSRPPGAPFPYGPLALLWYMPPIPAQVIETGVSIALLVLLALRGRLLGLAVYATAPVLVVTAVDGSNDTSLGLLLLVGLVVAERMPRTGAFLLGLAIAFKPTALAWALPMIGWAGWSGALALAVGAGLFWLPALVAWGPTAIADSIIRANTIHNATYYSLGHVLARFGVEVPRALLDIGRLAAAGGLALLALWRVRSADAVIGWGAAIFLVALFGGFWSTFAYFAALAPVVAWKLDGWLGRDDARVRWPGDPIGWLAARLNDRWPPLESGAERR